MVVLRVILEEIEKDGDILTTVFCKVFGLLGYWVISVIASIRIIRLLRYYDYESYD